MCVCVCVCMHACMKSSFAKTDKRHFKKKLADCHALFSTYSAIWTLKTFCQKKPVLFTFKASRVHVLLRAGPEYSIIRSVGWHSIFNFEIRISNVFFFFFWTPAIPRETVLNLSAWLNICSSNRPFANERRSCWPIAWIYFMKKSSISYKRACRTSTFEIMNLSAQKTRHVNGPSAITKPNVIHAFSFCQLSRDASESLGSVCSSSCSSDEMLWCETALREWKREEAVQLNHSRCFQMTDLIWQFEWIYLLI